MAENNVVEQAYGNVRLALPLMSKYNIPAIPQNFATWYEYVSGNKRVQKAIDQMILKKVEFTEERNKEIYQQFFCEQDEQGLTQIRDELQKLLVTVLSNIGKLTGQTEKYEASISKTVNKLSDDASFKKIKDIVGEITAETKSIGTFGKQMQNKLENTASELTSLQKELENVRTEATTDFLTGVSNRKAFDEKLISFSQKAIEENSNLSLLLLDIDHFKKFNDTFGHIVGDEVLKFVAKKTQTIVKGTDFFARFGGEEFVVILPGTPLGGAKVVAEGIRKFFDRTRLKTRTTSKDIGGVTLSIGGASYRAGEPLDGFIKRADKALYFAKENGRNKVATETDLS